MTGPKLLTKLPATRCNISNDLVLGREAKLNHNLKGVRPAKGKGNSCTGFGIHVPDRAMG